MVAKEKFTINSKDWSCEEYKIDFEGFHFIKKTNMMKWFNNIKRWAKEFMDEIKCPVCEGSRLKKEAQFLKSTKKYYRIVRMDISDCLV
jgi:excinuclease ABC subunit A